MIKIVLPVENPSGELAMLPRNSNCTQFQMQVKFTLVQRHFHALILTAFDQITETRGGGENRKVSDDYKEKNYRRNFD